MIHNHVQLVETLFPESAIADRPVADCLYCPSPAAGMGGSTAILGAAALADALHKHPGDLRAAFQEYDESFRPTVEGIQANAVGFGLEMFMPRSEEAIQRRNMQLGIF